MIYLEQTKSQMSRLVYQTASTMKKIYIAKVVGTSLGYSFRIMTEKDIRWVDLGSLTGSTQQSDEKWIIKNISNVLRKIFEKFEINIDEFNSKVEYSDNFISEVRQNRFGSVSTTTLVVPMELSDVMLFHKALIEIVQ